MTAGQAAFEAWRGRVPFAVDDGATPLAWACLDHGTRDAWEEAARAVVSFHAKSTAGKAWAAISGALTG